MKTPAVLRPAQPTHPIAPSAFLCLLDWQLGFFIHLIIVLKILMASRFCLDTSDNSNQSFVLGDTMCQERNHWSTIVLAILWVLLHVMLFLSTMLPFFVNKHVRFVAPRKMS